ncbi:uncharacterized protein DUF2630 [Lentzea atacamensis]|uniref:Uncharacterized protein DUF2630 n=2 Tax=Lentzea TaxID=165301 RepID=A0A316I9G4_9PSEU|nr:DUF2630 family protein [Lentzea atacamensis]PWK87042.1 uncharacterized protein DUF2630 [Lentzea atacamensis]RAS70250.1 uncharacterized protein DUF2630 [Lentzea atacamensis]
MSDENVLGRINELVDEEHRLREQLAAGEITTDEEHARLRALEEALDQCWDLLRRRRSARSQGRDADDVSTRSVGEVEGYLQ